MTSSVPIQNSGTINQPGQKPPSSPQPKPPKQKRGGGKAINSLLLVGILVAIGLFVWAEQKRRTVEDRLTQTEQQLEEVRKSTENRGAEVAKQVLEGARKHIEISSDPEPTVATIVDVERLRQSNEFYLKANNGDHLIITANRAILYNSQRDVVIDVVPVRIDKASVSPTPENKEPAAARSVSPTPSTTTEPQQ